MFDRNEKIQIVRYLESVTLGATASRCLESMTELQIDYLIRLCKVDPTNDESMMLAKHASDSKTKLHEKRSKELHAEMRAERYVASCADFDRLRSDDRWDFTHFVRENKSVFAECVSDDFVWLDDKELRPSVDFWTGELGGVVHEIVSRLLFGNGHIDFALAANYTYDGENIGPICSEILAGELDYETKYGLFWKYAKARLQ